MVSRTLEAKFADKYPEVLDAIRRMQQDSLRYKWLCLEFIAGRERDISEGLNTKQELDEYIDRKITKEFGLQVH
jgi:antitoxin component HigA of HigAB toxin-antitoxin module